MLRDLVDSQRFAAALLFIYQGCVKSRFLKYNKSNENFFARRIHSAVSWVLSTMYSDVYYFSFSSIKHFKFFYHELRSQLYILLYL